MKAYQRFFYLITFLSVLSILILKSLPRIEEPVLWAESGIFLAKFLEKGFFYIFQPDAGYFVVIQKLAVAVTSWFPVRFWPLAHCLLAIGFYSAIAAVFSQRRFSWLVPSDFNRFLFCLLFAFLPGLHEVIGNSANFSWMICFYFGLICLQDLKKPISRADMIFGGLCILSAGQTLLLLPVILYRRFLKKDSKLVYLAGLQILVAVFNYFFQRANPNTFEAPRLLEVFKAWQLGNINGLVLQPVFGSHFTVVLERFWFPGIFLFSAVILGFWILQIRKATPEKKLAHLFVLCWSGAVVIQCLARDWGVKTFGEKVLDGAMFYDRRGFVLAPAGVFFWMIWLSRFRRQAVFACFALSYFVLNKGWISLDSRRFGSADWVMAAPQVEKALQTNCAERLQIPIDPPGWFFEYEHSCRR